MLERRKAFVDISDTISDSAGVETHTYFRHHLENPDIPYEVTFVKIPPGHTESFRSHKTIEETIIPLNGQVNIFIRKDDGRAEIEEVLDGRLYDEDQESIIGITILDDGKVIFHIGSNNTRDIRTFDLDLSQGFHTGLTTYSLQNYSEESAVVAVIKRVNPDTLKENPDIFRTDKQMY